MQWLVCHVSVVLKAEVKLLSSFSMKILRFSFGYFTFLFSFVLHRFDTVSPVLESWCGVEFGCISSILGMLAPSIFKAK
jgi:hypothetical protein